MPNTVFVITGEHPDNCTGGSEFQAYLIAKGLSDFFEKTVFCTMFSKETFVKYERENLIHLSLKKKFLPGKIIQFISYVKKFQPDIFYVRCLYSFWWIKLVSILLKRPTVYHLSSNSQAEYQKAKLKVLPSTFLKNFYIWATQFSSLVIAQTKEQAEKYNATFGILPKVIYNGHMPINKQVTKDFSKIVVLWLGKAFKNPEKFAELSEVMKFDNRFEFAMIGMLSEDQEKRFFDLGKNNMNFQYLGKLPKGRVYKELERAHVLINTSYLEGFPNTFIESWQRGVIVISDKINPDKILTDKRVGFLCDTIDEIKNKLIDLFINRTNVAKEYSVNAMIYAEEYHNINIIINDIYDIIKPFLKVNGKSYFS